MPPPRHTPGSGRATSSGRAAGSSRTPATGHNSGSGRTSGAATLSIAEFPAREGWPAAPEGNLQNMADEAAARFKETAQLANERLGAMSSGEAGGGPEQVARLSWISCMLLSTAEEALRTKAMLEEVVKLVKDEVGYVATTP